MSETTTAVATAKDRGEMEYTPFGSEDPIKLSVQIIQKFIAVPTRSGAVCGDGDAIKFMMMCRSRRLNPFEGDAFLIGFDSKDGPKFTLITAHQAFLKRAEVHPEYDGIESGVVVRDKDGKLHEIEGDFTDDGQVPVGGWARVHFKNRKHPMYKKVKLSTFNQGFGRWQIDPAGMICKVAEADALRSSFPTMMGGMYLREEVDMITSTTTVEVPRAEAVPGPAITQTPFRREKKAEIAQKPAENITTAPAGENTTAKTPDNVIDVTAKVQQPDPQKAAQAPIAQGAAKSQNQSSAAAASAGTEPPTAVEIPPSKMPGWLPFIDTTVPTKCMESLREWLAGEEITDEELLAWCVAGNYAKAGMAVANLTTGKVTGILRIRERVRGEILQARARA